ncbi:MAG: hypothetical protein JKY65_04125 [Planctomycetes bacterium]|nr:hypothetical protein [Planctomycetota bacterium]
MSDSSPPRWTPLALAALVCLALVSGCPAPDDLPPPDDGPGSPLSVTLSSPAQVISGDVRIDVEAEDEDLSVVVERISQVSGLPIEVDPSVHETTTISLQSIPVRDALMILAKMSRCEVSEVGGLLRISQVEIVTLQFQEADVRTVLQLVAAYRGHSIELPDSLQGEVDVDLVVDEKTLQTVLDKVGSYRVFLAEGGLIRVEECKPVASPR